MAFFQQLAHWQSKPRSWLMGRSILTITLLLFVSLFILLKPMKFADLWLTRDQQGQLLFHLEKYQQAASIFENPQWQGFSFYFGEKFTQAATVYGQSNQVADKFAQANALAHGRHYIKARNLYRSVLSVMPEHKGAQKNIIRMQEIIDEVNNMSQSQQAEEGEAKSKELADAPKAGDGVDKEDSRQQELEQLTAEQLLLDPQLNEMWLRQVQKNPARFLARKFVMQLSHANEVERDKNNKADTLPNTEENNLKSEENSPK